MWRGTNLQFMVLKVLAKLNQLDKLDKILHKLGTITITYVESSEPGPWR